MYPVTLKVTDTDIARDKATKEPLPFTEDSPLFDPHKHDVCPFFYRGFFREITMAPLNRQTGFTPDENRLSADILRKLKKTKDGETMYLDHELWNHLNQKVQGVAYMVLALWIQDCREYVAKLEPIPDEKIGEAVEKLGETGHGTNGTAKHGKLVAV